MYPRRTACICRPAPRLPKLQPSLGGCGLERRSKGAERVMLSIPREIESAVAKRTLFPVKNKPEA